MSNQNILSLLDEAEKCDEVPEHIIDEIVSNRDNVETLIRLFLSARNDLKEAMWQLNAICSMAKSSSDAIESTWFKPKPSENEKWQIPEGATLV